MYKNSMFLTAVMTVVMILSVLIGGPCGLFANARALTPAPFRLAPGGVQPYADFNADGYSDLVVGVPHEAVVEWPLTFYGDEGSVNALYGSSAGISAAGDQTWSQGSLGINGRLSPDERFGSALAAADFNGDQVGDLAVGVPRDSTVAGGIAGGVNIIYGSVSSGLSNNDNQFWSQDSAGILDQCEPDDLFGNALAAGDFDGDGFADLAIGIPGETLVGVKCGAVAVLYGTPSGLSSAGNQLWAESGSGLAGVPVADGDHFGAALTVGDFNADGFADLAIGIPGKEIQSLSILHPETEVNAGAVRILLGSATGLTSAGTQLWSQNSSGNHASIADVSETGDLFGSALAAGDFDGDGFCDLAIGVPGESLSGILECGAANVILGGTAGLRVTGNQFFSRLTQGVFGGAAAGAHFGHSLTAADMNRDGKADLAIGAPFDMVSGQMDAGSVNVIYSTLGGLSAAGSVFLTQGTFGVGGVTEGGDNFGFSLTAGDYDANGAGDLVIGVPNEDYNGVDAGVIHIVYGDFGGLQSVGSQLWSQGTSGVQGVAQQADQFGLALR